MHADESRSNILRWYVMGSVDQPQTMERMGILYRLQ